MIGQLDSLDLEIRNHVSSCTAEARKMKDESEKKENQLSTVEKEADELLKVLSCVVFLKFIYSVWMIHGQTDDLRHCYSAEF
jgi:hypothetical protein